MRQWVVCAYWNVWIFLSLLLTQFSFWTSLGSQEIMGEKLRVKGCGHYSRLNCPSGDKRNFKGRWFLCSFRFSKGLQRITKRLPSQIFHTLKSGKTLPIITSVLLSSLKCGAQVFDGHSRPFMTQMQSISFMLTFYDSPTFEFWNAVLETRAHKNYLHRYVKKCVCLYFLFWSRLVYFSNQAYFVLSYLINLGVF